MSYQHILAPEYRFTEPLELPYRQVTEAEIRGKIRGAQRLLTRQFTTERFQHCWRKHVAKVHNPQKFRFWGWGTIISQVFLVNTLWNLACESKKNLHPRTHWLSHVPTVFWVIFLHRRLLRGVGMKRPLPRARCWRRKRETPSPIRIVQIIQDLRSAYG